MRPCPHGTASSVVLGAACHDAGVAYTTAEGRQELLDTIAEAANELGFATACLAEAYEQLDEQSGDRLEEACFRPVQLAYGRAKRAHTEFASAVTASGRRRSASSQRVSPPRGRAPS